MMGPKGSKLSKVGVELTDSIYVVLNMRIMTRMGRQALEMLGASENTNDFNRGLHSHARLQPGAPLHLPLPAKTTRSGASARGTAATSLLGKKCLALRVGSVPRR